jgi:hypothetical protein
MCAQAERLPDLRQAARQPLSEDEQVVRDIAFRGLSRKELLNLLTRRLWVSLRWMNPGNWRLRKATSPPNPPLRSGEGGSGHSRYEARNVEPPPHPCSPLPASGRGAGGEGWAAPVGDRT